MKKEIVLVIVLSIASLSVVAQQKTNKKDTIQHNVYYCGMDPDIKSDEPGRCPECGMELLLLQKEEIKKEKTKVYHCPVHLKVTGNKPGKCPRCGKNLILSKKKQIKEKGIF